MENDPIAAESSPLPWWGLHCLMMANNQELGLRLTALNFCCAHEGGLSKDWEPIAHRVMAFLKGEVRDNVVQFPKPKLVVDNDRPL